MADTDTKSTDPRLTALQRELALVKAQAELAEAQEKIRAAQPGADIKALEGDTTIDDKLSFEVESAAYEQLERAATLIAKEVKTKKTKGTVVIFDESLPAAFQNFRLFLAQATLLADDSKALQNEYAGPSIHMMDLAGAGALVRTAIDLISLFRTDTEFKGRAVTIKDRALIALIAGALVNESLQVVHPKTLPPGALQAPDGSIEPFKSVAMLQRVRSDLRNSMKETEQNEKELVAKLDPANAAGNRNLEVLIEREKSFRAQFDTQAKLIADYLLLLTTSTASGISPLSTLITAAAVLREMDSGSEAGEPALLDVEVSHAGGSYLIKKSLWRSDRLSHSGGVIVSYALYDNSSRIVISGVVSSKSAFKKITGG